MAKRVHQLQRALDHIIQHAPCSCPRRDPRIVVHADECYIGEAINIASDFDDSDLEDAEELVACEAHDLYGCPLCDAENDDD